MRQYCRVRYLGLATAMLLALAIVHPPAALATANLVFSPANGQVTIGSVWKTTVLVNSDGAVNSIDTTIVFPASNLEATGVDFSGGVFGLSLPGSGSIDNGSGTIRIIQASPSPFSGSGGKVATLSFKTKTLGPADLQFGATKVIAQDGKGTNVYSGGGTASVNVVSAASAPASTSTSTTTATNATTRTPVISSSSHPNQDAWYKSRSIAYSWTTTGQGYNFTVDQNPTTDLPETVVGTAASSSTTVASDGIWYAHVKAQGPNGWSSTAHFKFQIDTAPPGSFQVNTDPSGDVTVLPMVSFTTSDSGSGIDHYEAQIDGGSWSRQTSPFKAPSLNSGSHTVLVRAFDKAGNTTDAQTTFTLRQLDAPVITSPENKQLLMLGEQLKVQGKAAPNVQVDVYVNNKKVETTTSDSSGYFSTTQPLLLFAGAYQIVARAINKDGIVSAPSSPVTLTIDARAVKLFGNVWPGWVVLVGVILAIGLLALGLGIVGFLLWRKTSNWAARLQGLDDAVARDLALLEAHVDSSIDTSLGALAPEAGTIKSTLNSEISAVKTDVETLTKHGPTVTVAPKKPSLVSRLGVWLKRITPHISFGPAAAATPTAVEVAAAIPGPAITMPAAPLPQFAATPAPDPAVSSDLPAISSTVALPGAESAQPPTSTPNDAASVAPPNSVPTQAPAPEAGSTAVEPAAVPDSTEPMSNNQQTPPAAAVEASPSVDSQSRVLTAPTTAFPVATIPENFVSPATNSSGPAEADTEVEAQPTEASSGSSVNPPSDAGATTAPAPLSGDGAATAVVSNTSAPKSEAPQSAQPDSTSTSPAAPLAPASETSEIKAETLTEEKTNVQEVPSETGAAQPAPSPTEPTVSALDAVKQAEKKG